MLSAFYLSLERSIVLFLVLQSSVQCPGVLYPEGKEKYIIILLLLYLHPTGIVILLPTLPQNSSSAFISEFLFFFSTNHNKPNRTTLTTTNTHTPEHKKFAITRTRVRLATHPFSALLYFAFFLLIRSCLTGILATLGTK